MPRVSIVMSVYNKGLYLKDAIDSILRQTVQDFEFIIADNGSTDDSVKVIGTFNDTRIKFINNNRNLGMAASFNNCLERVTGEYVAIACGDDIWTQDFLSTNIGYLDEFPSINISYSPCHQIDNRGNVTPAVINTSVPQYNIVKYQDVIGMLIRGCCISFGSIVLRSGKFPFFDYRYQFTVDWDLLLKIAEQKNDFLAINKPLLYYRSYPDNHTSAGMKRGEIIMESYWTLRRFFDRNPEYSHLQSKALKIQAMSALRRSRDIASRTDIFTYHRMSLFIYPLILLNPLYSMYLAAATLFGVPGMKVLKTISRAGTLTIKKMSGRA